MLRAFEFPRLSIDWPEALHAVLFTGGALVAAALVHRLVFAGLRRIVSRTQTPVDGLIVEGAEGGVYSPGWYRGGSIGSASRAASSMTNAVSAAAASMTAAMVAAQPVSSSSSGFSGGGGGGSSGGGGGGGGGGGW